MATTVAPNSSPTPSSPTCPRYARTGDRGSHAHRPVPVRSTYFALRDSFGSPGPSSTVAGVGTAAGGGASESMSRTVTVGADRDRGFQRDGRGGW